MKHTFIGGREYGYSVADDGSNLRVWRRDDDDWTELEDDPVFDEIREYEREVPPEEYDRWCDWNADGEGAE